MDTNGHTILCEDYVSYETARLLKEKGFDIPVRFEYHCIYNVNQKPRFHKKLHNFNGVEYSGLTSKWYSAPSQSLALKWLREVHSIEIRIKYSDNRNAWVGQTYPLFKPNDSNFEYFQKSYSFDCFENTYEQACESAIKYCLENLI